MSREESKVGRGVPLSRFDSRKSDNSFLGTNPEAETSAAGNAVLGRSFFYGYDNIGNRSGATTNGRSSTYTNNALNQITERMVPGYADVSGFAAANAAVSVGGQAAGRQFDYFYRAVIADNTAGPRWMSLNVAAGSTTETRNLYIAKGREQFQYDADGNLTNDGRWDYTWDGENRLTVMTTTDTAATAGIPKQKVQFDYDYLGRRVQKTVSTWNAASQLWNPTARTRFVYSTTNWHLLAEYDALAGNAPIRTYSWGLDLSRTTTGAGGVGGLLSMYDTATATCYLPVYDGNGNVFALINKTSGAMAAAYEYSAFGETLRATGPFADKNPIRFSTKYTDSETQLVYYGYRYYAPTLGRWLGRDPKAEDGGLHLYGFCGNNAVDKWDFLGMDPDLTWRLGADGTRYYYHVKADASLQYDYGMTMYANHTGNPDAWQTRPSSFDSVVDGWAVNQLISMSSAGAGPRGVNAGPDSAVASTKGDGVKLGATMIQLQDGTYAPLGSAAANTFAAVSYTGVPDHAAGGPQPATMSPGIAAGVAGTALAGRLLIVGGSGTAGVTLATATQYIPPVAAGVATAGGAIVLSGAAAGIPLGLPATGGVLTFKLPPRTSTEMGPAVPTTWDARSGPPSQNPQAEGRPHSVLTPDGGYVTYHGDGTWIQYRPSGQDHGGIPRPNVKETTILTALDGRTFISNPNVRPPRPGETPGRG